MNVLEIAASTRVGGAETYLVNLTRHLRQNGHVVSALTRRGAPLGSLLQAEGARVWDFHRGGKWNLPVLIRLVNLIRRERIELIHTHLFSACRIGGLASKITGVPVVGHVHALDPADVYARVPTLIAVSNGVREHMIGQGIAPQRLRLFPNHVDLNHFNPALFDKTRARREMGFVDETFVLACVASLTPRKGHAFLLRALVDLPENVELIIAGEGGEMATLKALAGELKLESRVRFAGFQSDVRPLLRAADAFVLPSLHEGMPISLLEAMAMNCPVVATRIAGVPEIVREGETGKLVEPADSAALRDAILELIPPARRLELAHNARVLVEEHHDSRRCFPQLETFFQDLIARGAKPNHS